MRLPDPSSIPEFDLPFNDIETPTIPLRVFRFPGGLEDPSRAVICVPGMAASGVSFARLFPLSDLYDFRLLSGPVEAYPGGSRVPFAGAVESILDRFENPVLLGTSFGGLVALETASRSMGRLRGLVLPAAFARNHAFPGPLRVIEKILPRLQFLARLTAPIAARFVGGLRLDRDAARELARQSSEVDPAERGRRLEEVFETDFRAVLPTIDLPSLVIHGSRDRLVSKRDALELAALLPRSDYREIVEAGHMPYVSHPRQFNALLEEFLTDVFV
ncbi:MAG: alpha/beta fold hydrolase [Thermoanaerobaculia bacterium]|nr:alpha/beta fold hydrolase [Thermoanaerobaculia bacterium]